MAGLHCSCNLTHHMAPPRYVCVFRWATGYGRRSGSCKILALGDRCWSWCADPVVFGVLVDMDRGCVTFRLNDMDGPCVRFPPTAQWREGVSLTVDEFPQEDTSPRVVISCATPPAPPSLLAAAANPLCVDGHLARGTLYADGNARDHNPDGDY